MKGQRIDGSALDLAVLECLGTEGRPVGAGTLQHALRRQSLDVGEATVGRLLRRFDQLSLTKRHGKQGRTLTERGHSQLLALRRAMERKRDSDDLAEALDGSNPAMLIDTLVGRRAVERETARLAALRLTEADAERLREIDEAQRAAKTRGLSATQENQAFHRVLAEIAGNPVLQRTLDLILNEFEVSEVLVEVRRRVGAALGVEHGRIIEAILRREPDGAEEAMAQHIDRIIEDVIRYYEQEGVELPEAVTTY